jgi:hypothetical protein
MKNNKRRKIKKPKTMEKGRSIWPAEWLAKPRPLHLSMPKVARITFTSTQLVLVIVFGVIVKVCGTKMQFIINLGLLFTRQDATNTHDSADRGQ